MTTTAEKIAERFENDGLRFEARDGITLNDACLNAVAIPQKGRQITDEDGEGGVWRGVPLGESIYDAIRYVFKDGSAIVVCGDAWDIEGASPFSWAGAE